ncbi:RNA polymerase sigma factor [Porticoccaceae bacterium]|nr:RNA polymerase sigma factor [Porticoccaceae bacterium]MDC1143941.1 RNA polymerase sigma factor [Porticoccaceae bacterium]
MNQAMQNNEKHVINRTSENVAAEAIVNQLPYQTMEQFLKYIERRAFHMARLNTGDTDVALDVVQDAMYKLVQKYSEKTAEEWKPLFYQILSRKLTDYYRRKSVRDKVLIWAKPLSQDDQQTPIDLTVNASAPNSETPHEMHMRNQRIAKLDQSVKQLPHRQRQAFMLRCWEGLSTIDTALAMGCSQGSVKTHYSRAMHSLREMLEDYRND